MRCEDQQIPTSGAPGRLRGGLPGAPRAPAPVQPQEVHPAPAHGVPGAQGVLPPRLSRLGGAPRRPPRPLRADRPEGRPPLHHLPEGRPAAPGRRPRAGDVRRGAGSGAGRSRAQAPRPPGGHRRHGPGVAPRQPLLHEASGRREARRRQDLRAFPEGRLRGRLREPHDPRGGPRPGAGHRPGAIRAGLGPGRPSGPDRGAAGRRRLRRRVAARRGAVARRADDHPADAGPALGQAPRRAMAARDEGTVRPARGQVWSEVAGGDGELDDQTSARLGAPRAGGAEPIPRDHLASHHA